MTWPLRYVHARFVANMIELNTAITSKLVDTVTTPMLLKLVQSGKLQPSQLITHRKQIMAHSVQHEPFS